MANTTQKTTEQKKEFNLTQVFAVWKQKAKSGRTFLSGKDNDGVRITGFYNTHKKNPKEPDVRFYIVDNDGELSENTFCSMWSNFSEKTNRTYLTGSLEDGTKVVGFINNGNNEKAPYLTVYLREEKEDKPKNLFEQQAEQNMKKDDFVPVAETDEDLPF